MEFDVKVVRDGKETKDKFCIGPMEVIEVQLYSYCQEGNGKAIKVKFLPVKGKIPMPGLVATLLRTTRLPFSCTYPPTNRSRFSSKKELQLELLLVFKLQCTACSIL